MLSITYVLVSPVAVVCAVGFIACKAVEVIAAGAGAGFERAFGATRGVVEWLEEWSQGREAEATEDVARRLEELSKRRPHG